MVVVPGDQTQQVIVVSLLQLVLTSSQRSGKGSVLLTGQSYGLAGVPALESGLA